MTNGSEGEQQPVGRPGVLVVLQLVGLYAPPTAEVARQLDALTSEQRELLGRRLILPAACVLLLVIWVVHQVAFGPAIAGASSMKRLAPEPWVDAGWEDYEIREGDQIWALLRERYGISDDRIRRLFEAVKEANPGHDLDHTWPGQQIRLPEDGLVSQLLANS